MTRWIALGIASLLVLTASPGMAADPQDARELARGHLDRGDVPAARGVLEAALPGLMDPKTPPLRIAETLLDLADTLDDLGLHADAKTRRTEALPALDRLLTDRDLAALDVLSRLTDAAQDRLDTQPLEPRLAAALELVKLQTPGHLDPRRSLRFLSAMGSLMGRLGQFDLALQLLTGATQFVAPEREAQALDLGFLSIRLGQVHVDQGNLAKARQFFTYALGNLEPRLGLGHPVVGRLHGSLATVLFRLGDRDAAWTHLQAARKTLDRTELALREAPLPQAVKMAEHNRTLFSGELLLTLALHRARTRPEAAADLVGILLRRKGALLEALLPHGEDRPSAKVLGIRAQLQVASARLAQAWLQNAGEVARPDLLAQTARLEQERDRLESELAAASPKFRAETQDLTLPALCKALPEHGALLEYVHFAAPSPIDGGVRLTLRYAGVLVRKDGCAVTVRDLGEAVPVRTLVQTWRKALTRGGRGAAALDEPQPVDADGVARQLYATLWAPFAPGLTGLEVLLVAPDDQLRFVPFAALPTPEGKLLLDAVPMAQIASGREVLRLRGLPPPGGKGALVLAAPEFGPPQTRKPAGPDKCVWREGGWPELPGTKQEAEVVQALLLGAHQPTTVRLGKDATEVALRKDAPGKRYVELATHGWFAPETCAGSDAVDRNPLLLSGLVLAGANRAPQADQDGWLTAAELAGLDLTGAQLVVLSACETGLGQTRTAMGEGVFGLERALTQAGARSVVLSLWQVADEETAALMGRFWRGVLVGKTPSWRALVEAQRGLRAELMKTRGVADPGLWAAFVHVGGWQ
jgi:CHAT domain-containing protein